MEIVQLSTKGQLVIPVGLRRRMGLRPGRKLSAELESGSLVLRPLSKYPFERYFGIARGKGLVRELLAMRRREKKRDRALGLR